MIMSLLRKKKTELMEKRRERFFQTANISKCNTWSTDSQFGEAISKPYLAIKSENIDEFDEIFEILSNKIDISQKTFYITISQECYLNKQQCEKLVETRKMLREANSNLLVEDGDLFELEDIIASNEKIDNVIDKIKNARVESENNRPLNDIEKFIWAYHFVAKRKYRENQQDFDSARHITSIFKNQDCVCLGFATLLKEMCNRLEIECYINGCKVIEKNTGLDFGHANNIVVLDNKVYYCDACFDCDTETRPKDNYAYCLISIEETKNLLELELTNHDAPFATLNEDKELLNMLSLNPNDKETYQKLYTKYKDLLPKYEHPNESLILSSDIFSLLNNRDNKEHLFYIEEMQKLLTNKSTANLNLSDFENALKNVYACNGLGGEYVEETIKYNTTLATKKFDSHPRFNAELVETLYGTTLDENKVEINNNQEEFTF